MQNLRSQHINTYETRFWRGCVFNLCAIYGYTYPSNAHSRRRCLPRDDRRIALGDGDVRAALRVTVGEMERASAAGRIVGEVWIGESEA